MIELSADDLQSLNTKFCKYLLWRMRNGNAEEEKKRLVPILKWIDDDFVKAAKAEGWNEGIYKVYERAIS